MKATIIIFIAVLMAIAALIFGHAQMSKERAADEAADQPITAASRVQTSANGETVFALAPKTQGLIGLQTATLADQTLPPEIKAYGRVLDSVSLVSLQNDALAARAAAQASQREYDRLKKLSAEDNASARALESAEAQMKHDQSALATAEAQLVAASGKTMADAPPDFFSSLARQESVLVRLDLPAGETPGDTPTAALLTLPGTAPPVTADFLGRAATTDPQVQGAGFLFLVTNAPAALTPGLALTGFLQLPGESLRGVVVPETAVVRSDGRAWIYVQTGDTFFARREISLDQPAAGGWFATNGVAAGDKVVVTGAQTLLSEEHKTEIQIGD
jgi:hypothetical protein